MSNGMKKRKTRDKDIEKIYSKTEFIKKLRRFADALENGKRFSIQIASEKISVPKNAVINIEHEKGEKEEEVEFQIKWEK
ncbi:MAG: amphi-Trp domain-containing protein [Nanoarchaeota archaeon]|nr:amphi-Trp domain-containing protein [Nanoarchaeota archaeon]